MNSTPAAPDSQTAYIGLGGNVGSEEAIRARLQSALAMLEESRHTRVLQVSSVYRSSAWGVTDQPDFLNAVAKLETKLPPVEFLAELKQIEERLGRKTRQRWGPREIDLDILLYGNFVLQSEGLTIPHPGIRERSFVYVPLQEIAPGIQLPDGRTLVELQPAAGQLSRVSEPLQLPGE